MKENNDDIINEMKNVQIGSRLSFKFFLNYYCLFNASE